MTMPKRQQSWWNPTFGWFGTKERQEYMKYQAEGGGLGMNQWLREGKPPPPTRATMTPEQAEARVTKRKAEAEETERKGRQARAEEDIRKATDVETQRWEREFAEKQRQFNESMKLKQSESGVKMYSQYGINPYDNPETPEEEGQFNPYTGHWEAPQGWVSPQDKWQRDWQQRQSELQQQQFQSQMLWYQQQAQMQQQEQERQYKSQLMANPMSWLQYAAYTSTNPVVQPWMTPLMQGRQAGQPIQGWQTKQQEEGQPMGSLQQMTNPSAQYWARMGPTAQQQYLGYEQARTGIRPEESMFRRRAGSAPGGLNTGLRWMR